MACPLCHSPNVYLDLKQGQRVLEHLGAHILFDKKVSHTDEPCGCCLRPGALCLYYLTKGKGQKGKPKIDWDRTRSCPTKLTSKFLIHRRRRVYTIITLLQYSHIMPLVSKNGGRRLAL